MQDNSLEIIFGRQQPAHLKGVAAVLLILHYPVLFPSSNSWLTNIPGNSLGDLFFSYCCKALYLTFFFVSGYGLYQSSLTDLFRARVQETVPNKITRLFYMHALFFLLLISYSFIMSVFLNYLQRLLIRPHGFVPLADSTENHFHFG